MGRQHLLHVLFINSRQPSIFSYHIFIQSFISVYKDWSLLVGKRYQLNLLQTPEWGLNYVNGGLGISEWGKQRTEVRKLFQIWNTNPYCSATIGDAQICERALGCFPPHQLSVYLSFVLCIPLSSSSLDAAAVDLAALTNLSLSLSLCRRVHLLLLYLKGPAVSGDTRAAVHKV